MRLAVAALGSITSLIPVGQPAAGNLSWITVTNATATATGSSAPALGIGSSSAALSASLLEVRGIEDDPHTTALEALHALPIPLTELSCPVLS